MYLEKLELQGFKSFASKNKLIFSGLIDGQKRGLTAIVGPNGAGKSNVADAIRWALGEQSLKTLRGKKSEDVIFSGSDKKNQLGFAEVSLFLNNAERTKRRGAENAATPAAIETENDFDALILSCPEIVITRRLYRNGDSEYLLNGSRVRLADTQMLLAKANFGQKTYSVIGQGMVENFLSSSAAERKDFFDEATGVKQFQIKRDTALNKLEGSYGNLQQVDMLLAEIKPRLKSLTRQVDRLNKRSQLETELKDTQLTYYHQIWQEINSQLDEYNGRYLEREKIKIDRDQKFGKLNEELNKIKVTDHGRAVSELQPQLQELYNAKNQLHKQAAKIQAELEMSLEAQGQFDLSWLNAKEAELKANLEKTAKELAPAGGSSAAERDLEEKLRAINSELAAANTKLKEASREISGGPKREQTRAEVNKIITDFLAELEDISQLEELAAIKTRLQEAQKNFRAAMENFLTAADAEKFQAIKEIQENVIALNEKRQEVFAAWSEERSRQSAGAERRKLWEAKQTELKRDLADISSKLGRQAAPADAKKIQAEKNDLDKKLAALNEQIKKLEAEQEKLNAAKEQEKSLIFDYQRQLQTLQAEINLLTTELNDLKINATRQETRLEDLEANIRGDELNLAEIKNYLTAKEIDPESAGKRIASLKSQLEQIGGIDPEAEKEYRETKERYDFLSGQVADLDQTIKSLEEIIYELDRNIKDRFNAEFKVISEKFNDYFKILFSGGSAKISKLMIEDLEKEETKNNQAGAAPAGPTGETEAAEIAGGLTPAENAIKKEMDEKFQKIKFLKKHNAVGLAGIEIQATPPGKKIQTVAMLSGGERALTAIALICAIINANPSPFVVLDEVDAALDEANSQRLAKILDDLSNQTQFIIITHNRACMRQASILYGVTMESDGVSKLLSVKLDELKK
jgi:chromosome segregation protein